MWLIKLIPGLSTLLTWGGNFVLRLYSQKLAADGAHDAKAVELATREIALDQREAEINLDAKAQIRHIWYAPENLMFYFVAFPYWLKAITVDNIVWPVAYGHVLKTAPLQGDTAKAMMMVMAFWFGLRGVRALGDTVKAVLTKRN